MHAYTLTLFSCSDFAHQKDMFQTAIDLFGSTDEDIRSAAAFAAGNIAIGNLHLFLPAIVKLVQIDKEKRLLALHALKEVVSNCPELKLESVAETIWVPLFQDSANSEESTRNVAAACLGKLTTTNPSRYLPQLHVSVYVHQKQILFLLSIFRPVFAMKILQLVRRLLQPSVIHSQIHTTHTMNSSLHSSLTSCHQ